MSEQEASVNKRNVILLPGGVAPAKVAYAPLMARLAGRAVCLPKEVEIFAGPALPADYTLDLEVEGVLRAAHAAGFATFDLVGYSLGGAIALATAAAHPDRVASLALIEPAPIQALSDSPEDDAMWQQIPRLFGLSPEARAQAQVAMLVQPGTPPPARPAVPPPPDMARRAAAFEPLMRATSYYPLDLGRLRRFQGPVWLGLGSQSNPIFARQAHRLQAIWPQMRIEEFVGLHHLNPPHLASPDRVAAALTSLWA